MRDSNCKKTSPRTPNSKPLSSVVFFYKDLIVTYGFNKDFIRTHTAPLQRLIERPKILRHVNSVNIVLYKPCLCVGVVIGRCCANLQKSFHWRCARARARVRARAPAHPPIEYYKYGRNRVIFRCFQHHAHVDRICV